MELIRILVQQTLIIICSRFQGIDVELIWCLVIYKQEYAPGRHKTLKALTERIKRAIQWTVLPQKLSSRECAFITGARLESFYVHRR